MDSLMVIFKKEEIQRRQNDQESRCHQYDLALQRVAPDPVLVCSDIAPDEEADASRNNQQHNDDIEIDVAVVKGQR